MTVESQYTALGNTHKAVRDYAWIEFEGLCRRVIFRLQRINASGIYGDDYAYKSLWDEWCHEVQKGPHDLLESAWEQTITPFLDDVIERIPRHSATLLSIFAAWELGEDLEAMDIVGSYRPDDIRRVLQNRLAEQAGKRSIYHLGPWRDLR